MSDLSQRANVRNSLHKTQAVIIELAGEPKGKARPRFARRTGHAYTPQKTASFEAMLRHEAAVAMGGRPPLEGALRVQVNAYFGVPQSWSAKKRAAALAGAIRPANVLTWTISPRCSTPSMRSFGVTTRKSFQGLSRSSTAIARGCGSRWSPRHECGRQGTLGGVALGCECQAHRVPSSVLAVVDIGPAGRPRADSCRRPPVDGRATAHALVRSQGEDRIQAILDECFAGADFRPRCAEVA